MEISKVGVIGMGTMGSQIGIVCGRAGFETRMAEISAERQSRGRAQIEGFLRAQQEKGRLQPGEAERILARIRAGTDLEAAVAEADLVIEAVPEDMTLKKEVFRRLDRSAPAHSILASNTSTLWISEMGAATGRPQKCIGTHFLIPAALTPLVEVVRGLQTSDETHAATVGFLERCGKETVTVMDSPGFVINRLYLPLVNEAFLTLETGVASAGDIDRSCVRGLGFPLGPLAAADAFGLDVLLACMQTFQRELGEKYRPAPLLVKLVRAGRLGRKSGRGVYAYQ